MRSHRPPAIACCVLMLCSLSAAEVLVDDSGVRTSLAGPGAPKHIIGLQRHLQTISLNTGVKTYGVSYTVATDPEKPEVAIPGEGYIGMPRPVSCNWYAGGFFDLQLNGETIGGTPISSLTGRSSGDRGTVDFVFDTPLSLIRIRFVALDGGDCLFAQVLLEPKQEITSVQVLTRCYPSAYVSNSERRVLTPTRDLLQGERADLDLPSEWWTLYYDRVYDAGFAGPTQRGVGPCAMLWLPDQTQSAGFTVGGYGTESAFTLEPSLREFRFVFLDYAGTPNADAQADLQARGARLLEELSGFSFTDPVIAEWPLEEKRAEVARVLATMPQEQDAAAQYERWSEELDAQLALLRSEPAGSIEAEAEAARIINEWEQGLPMLRLNALLSRI